MEQKKIYFIVDDDINDQQFLIEALVETDPSCKCFTASNGQEAITNLIDGILPIPDVIFLDLNMPLFNGRECLAVLKETPSLKDIPIIIYSTSSDKEEIQEITKQGASYFLVKKNGFKELFEELCSMTILTNHVINIGVC